MTHVYIIEWERSNRSRKQYAGLNCKRKKSIKLILMSLVSSKPIEIVTLFMVRLIFETIYWLLLCMYFFFNISHPIALFSPLSMNIRISNKGKNWV